MNTESKKELMALLPSSIKTTKELTTKTKLVIAQLILMNGMDKVKSDGYFFITNQKLVEELGISEPTIIKILRNLELNNFITRKVGKRGEASEYIVNEDVIKAFGKSNTTKVNTKIHLNSDTKNLSNNLETLVINLSNKIDAITLKYNNLEDINTKLYTKILELETLVINLSNNKPNLSTDTDTDIESDIEKEKDIKNNIYNINKKEDNNINIYKEEIEEVGLIENPTSEKEKKENYENIEEVGLVENPTSDKIEIEDNNTFQLCEVGMLEEKENTTSTVKEKFEKNFNDLLARLGDNCSSVSELDDKVTLLCNWVDNHNTDYTKEERETILNQLVDRYTEVKAILESNINELDAIFTDFCTIKEEEPIVEEKKTTTKEELIKNLQAFQESLVTYENLEDAKHQLHLYCDKEDKLIKEYGLTSMVGNIINEINLQIEANKAFLTTFNLQDKETYYNEEIMQENALKSISYKVDDTEDYPF